MRRRDIILFSITWIAGLPFLGVPVSSAQVLPAAIPEDVGVSSKKLEKITEYTRELIAAQKVSGAVTVVARKGKVVYFEADGMLDAEKEAPMREDTIFRIASMTKPIASVAVMILYDEGKLELDDPVSVFIPELRNLKVIGSATPAKPEITIRHLLSHTSGLTYSGLEMPGVLYRKAKLAEGLRQEHVTLKENMETLAQLPLAFNPGEQWEYGVNTDVLGRVVEVASGMSFDKFLRERLFAPLKMKDTHFYLPKSKIPRLATPYRFSAQGNIERVSGNKTYDLSGYLYSIDYAYRGPRRYFSGNAGLCSTVPDYVRFCQMLVNRGVLDDARILKAETVALMTDNHIGDLETMYGQKFGLGFQVIHKIDEGQPEAWLGCCNWGGFFTTTFCIHPEDNWLLVSMAQVVWDKEFSRLAVTSISTWLLMRCLIERKDAFRDGRRLHPGIG